MEVTPLARLPSRDSASELLFAARPTARASGLFPGGHFRDPEWITRRIDHLDHRRNPAHDQANDPGDLHALLAAENAFAPLHPAQEKNLAAVRNGGAAGGAVFILTGQQPGLFGGPALWYYKALSAAALAKEWTARLGRPVVPLFWVAGDDSDLAESNRLELLDPRASEVTAALSLPFGAAGSPLTMGGRRIEGRALAGLYALLGDLEKIWGREAADALRACYSPGASLAEGFARLAARFLGPEGVLLVDGNSPRLRAATAPVLREAVRRRADLHAALEKGTEALAASGIEAPVALRPDAAHAFLLRDGERHRLHSLREMVYEADRPGRNLLPELDSLTLTHDVFTRPLVAERAFPVLGHVLGPAELRYFGQLAPAFVEFTGHMPLLHPRLSATALPLKAWKDLQLAGYAPAEILRLKPSALRRSLVQAAWESHPASAALGAEPVARWLEVTRALHTEHFADPGPLQRLDGSLRKAWRQYRHSLQRMVYAGAPGRENLFAHLRWLANGQGQDRHLNLHSLIAALGAEGFAAFRKQLDPSSTEIQVFGFEK